MYILSVLTTKVVTELIDVLIKLIMVVISQCMGIKSSCCTCFENHIGVKAWGGGVVRVGEVNGGKLGICNTSNNLTVSFEC